MMEGENLPESDTNLPDEDMILSLESPDNNGNIASKQLRVSSIGEKYGLGEALQSIRENLKVGRRVLLAIAWCREDERQLFVQFPEVIMIDVTMGTNNQGLPLLGTCCPGPDMKIFSPVRAFLPSQCKWVFGWIWGTALPVLLGKKNLKKTQLVLSDGDSKIYNSFEEHRDSTYPSAMHGLCIFHLVTKPLSIAGSRLQNKDDPFVKDQIVTFKHWVFSWMQLGGVENEEEFNISRKLLLEWLASFRDVKRTSRLACLQDALSHNSRVLEQILLTAIMTHKSRWFFPYRAHLIHLQQKTTSSLEGLFNTTKCKASKVVTPNMSLITSVRTQDLQVKNRMNEFARKSQMEVEATALWTDSTSAKELTTMAESFKHVLLDQSDKYHVRLVGDYNVVELLRKKQNAIFCHECLGPDTELCCKCYSQSPIPNWVRIRTVAINSLGDGWYSLVCDCLHNDGYPCRHIACITPIHYNHFIPRYHKKYIAYFGRKEPEYSQLNQYYKNRLNDRRFLIDNVGRMNLLKRVEEAMELTDDTVWNVPKVTCNQRTKKGLIPHQVANLIEVSTPEKDIAIYSQGVALSQEFGLPEESPAMSPLHQPQLTGHFYNDNVAMVGVLSNHASRDKTLQDKLSNIMRGAFAQALNVVQDHYKTEGEIDCNIVDLYPASDTRRKDRRIRAQGEFDRDKKKKSHGHETVTKDMYMD